MTKSKKFACIAATVAIASAVIGCATIPTIDKMFNISRAIGYSAGLVANEIKMDAKVRNNVIDIWTKVSVCIPETNQTFAAAWTPIAQKHTDELVKKGKIDASQATLIMLGFKAAVAGLDYVFIRYPEAKLYKDLTVAAVDGFNEGFLATFKPVNMLGSGKSDAYEGYDREAYDYLKSAVNKR